MQETLQLDPLDYWALYLDGQPIRDNQARLDVAFDLIRSGFFADAKAILEHADRNATDGSVPMVLYTLGYIAAQSRNTAGSSLFGQQKRRLPITAFRIV